MSIELKPIRQSESFCGPASLASLLNYYGQDISQEEIGRICEATIEYGTEPKAMLKGLKSLGFNAVAKDNGTWEDLMSIISQGTPIIVNWWSEYELPADGHYSVVYKMTNENICIMDPELGGSRTISKDSFMNNWFDYFNNGENNFRWYLYIKSK